MAGVAGGVSGSDPAPPADDLPAGVSAAVDGQILCDATRADTADTRGQPRGGPVGPQTTPLSDALRREIVGKAAGNPFFLEELTRDVVAHADRHATLVIPDTVQAVLAARMDQLPPEEKRLLQTAAVIGMDVPLPLLQAVAELPDDALNRGLAHLQAVEFLYETHRFPEREYTFKHALTHEVAYEALLQERRRMLHVRIMTALEGLYADRLAEQVDRLAHHAIRGEVWDKAVTYGRQAGAKAAERSALREAARPLSRPWRPSSISPTVAPRASRPSISASTCAMRCIPSMRRGGSSTTCARRNPLPRRSVISAGWDNSPAICLCVCGIKATLTKLWCPPSARWPLAQPWGTSACRSPPTASWVNSTCGS